MMDEIGIQINIPMMPIKAPPIVTEKMTQIAGRPTEFPTVLG